MVEYFEQIGRASQAVYRPGSTFGSRRMHDFEFIWINQGDVVWTCDGQPYDCPANSIILACPGMEDGFRWDPVKQTRHSFVHFSLTPRFFKDFPEYADHRQWPRVIVLPNTNIVFPLFDHLRLVQSQPSVCLPLEHHCLLQILLSFINNQCDLAGNTLDNFHPALQRVFAYLNTIWTDVSMPMPSIQALSSAAGVSEAHLGRLFHEGFGVSPSKSIRAMRMERAAHYLLHTDMQVQEISELLVCDNPYHFSRSFKSVYGRSPRDYRDHYRAHPLEAGFGQSFSWSENVSPTVGLKE